MSETTPQQAPAVTPRESSTEVLPAVKAAAQAENAPVISIAGHPRAARLVRRSREAAGLAGFLVAGWMSLGANSIAGTLLRAIVAGLACQVIVWAAAVLLSKHLITAELRSREYALMGAARAQRERAGANPQLAGAPARGNGA